MMRRILAGRERNLDASINGGRDRRLPRAGLEPLRDLDEVSDNPQELNRPDVRAPQLKESTIPIRQEDCQASWHPKSTERGVLGHSAVHLSLGCYSPVGCVEGSEWRVTLSPRCGRECSRRRRSYRCVRRHRSCGRHNHSAKHLGATVDPVEQLPSGNLTSLGNACLRLAAGVAPARAAERAWPPGPGTGSLRAYPMGG